MARDRVRIIDMGWEDTRSELRRLHGTQVEVGIQTGAKGGDGTSLAARAMFNEYGTKKIPSRSFMRTAFDTGLEALVGVGRKVYDAILLRKLSANDGARLMGEFHQNQVTGMLDSITSPPNSPVTIERKGSSKPLVDSGDMRTAIRYEIKERG